MRKETLCWDCKNSGGGCSWSKSFEPVEGWDAEKSIIHSRSYRPYESYYVKSCPKFEKRYFIKLKNRIDFQFYYNFKSFKNELTEYEQQLAMAYFTKRTEDIAKEYNISIRTVFRKIEKIKSKLKHLEILTNCGGGFCEMDIQQIMAIDYKNKKKLKAMFPSLTDDCGIYILSRIEDGIKYAYVGQAKHILTRLAQHLRGFQHIDLSIKNHGWYSDENTVGYRVISIKCLESELDEKEQFYIKECQRAGYQLRNKTAGGQGTGKTQIDTFRPAKGYYDGLRQGAKNIKKELNHIIEKYLDISLKKDNVSSQKALAKFYKILSTEEKNE